MIRFNSYSSHYCGIKILCSFSDGKIFEELCHDQFLLKHTYQRWDNGNLYKLPTNSWVNTNGSFTSAVFNLLAVEQLIKNLNHDHVDH